MDINNAILILEALADGCSPITGEVINDDSVLNERNVIRALQVAIDKLKGDKTSEVVSIQIDENDISSVSQLFKDENQNLTPNKLANFFLANSKIQNENIISNHLFGKYKGVYQKGQLLDYFDQYLTDHPQSKKKERKSNPWDNVDFFEKDTFNRLSDKAENQLKEKINQLGIIKTEKLSNYVIAARKMYPRAYESWNAEECELLKKALQYTNDVTLLSECFQRGKGSIISCGKKLIYEEQQSDLDNED